MNPNDPGYWQGQRVQKAPEWPDKDPEPVIRSTDRALFPMPMPRGVKQVLNLAHASGWPAEAVYARGFLRATKTGTYREVESFGVHTPPAHGWRWVAIYLRTVDLEDGWGWNVDIWKPDHTPVAGPSSMSRFTYASVTDLKDFLKVRGSVQPLWFKEIHAREMEKAAKAKATVAKPAKRDGLS